MKLLKFLFALIAVLYLTSCSEDGLMDSSTASSIPENSIIDVSSQLKTIDGFIKEEWGVKILINRDSINQANLIPIINKKNRLTHILFEYELFNEFISKKVNIKKIDDLRFIGKKTGLKNLEAFIPYFEEVVELFKDVIILPDCYEYVDCGDPGQICIREIDCSEGFPSGLEGGGSRPSNCTTCSDGELLPYSDNMTTSTMMTNLQTKYYFSSAQRVYLENNASLISTIYLAHNSNDFENQRARNLYNVLDDETPLSRHVEILVETALLKALHPNWPKWRVVVHASLNVLLNDTHTFLDVAGLVPGVGEVADFTNGLLYLIQGEKEDALISFAATIPIVGAAGPSTRIYAKLIRPIGSNKTVELFIKEQNGIVKFTKGELLNTERNSTLFRQLMKTPSDKIAHHVISFAKRQKPIIQKAARSGKFHINDVSNGFNIDKALHTGYDNAHRTYDTNLDIILDQMNTAYGNESYEYINNKLFILMNNIKGQLNAGKTLDQVIMTLP